MLKDFYSYLKNYNEHAVVFNFISFSAFIFSIWFFTSNKLIIAITEFFAFYFLFDFTRTLLAYRFTSDFILLKDTLEKAEDSPRGGSMIVVTLTFVNFIYLKIGSLIFKQTIEEYFTETMQKQIIFNKKYTKQDIINMNREELLQDFNFLISFEERQLRLVVPNYDLENKSFLDRTKLLDFAKEKYE